MSDINLWNRAADAHAHHTGDGGSFFRRLEPFLGEQLGDVRGRRVLDVGCGHGWLASRLHRAGAAVHGVDGSVALIQRAQRAYPEIQVRVHDLTGGLPAIDAAYDAVIAHMVLMDLATVDSLLADVRSALTPDGVFVFSILHPSFFSHQPVQEADGTSRYRKVTGYLEHERRWITTFGGHHHYHRPLSWYVAAPARSGLAVTAMQEPPTLPTI